MNLKHSAVVIGRGWRRSKQPERKRVRCFVGAIIPSARNKRGPDSLTRQSNPINIIATLLMTYDSSTLGGLSSDHNPAR
jgi:hypothetical protein